MKRLNYLILLMFMITLSSCSSDIEDFIPDGRKITIGVSLPTNKNTRVNFDNGIQKIIWNSNDRLTLMGYGTDGKFQSYNLSSEIKTGINMNRGTFNVSLRDTWNSCEFSYLSKNIRINNNDKNYPYSLRTDNQVQNGVGEFNHLKDYILLKSKKIPVTELNKPNKTIILTPETSILKLNIRNLPEEMMNDSKYIFKYFLNYGSSLEKCMAQLTLNGAIKADVDNYVYMAFNPKEGVLNANNKIAFEITSGKNSATVYATATEEKIYEGGKIYTATLDYKKNNTMRWISSENEELFSTPTKRSPAVLLLYSGQNCSICTRTTELRQEEQDKYGADNYIFIAMHGSKYFSAIKGQVQLFNEESLIYRNNMNVDESVPHPFFNMLGTLFVKRNVVDIYNEDDNMECKLDVKIIDDSKYKVSVETHLRSDKKDYFKNKQIDVLLWSLEDGVVAFQHSKGANHVHNHIFRGSINGVWGETYKIGTKYEGTFNIPVSVGVKENTDVVAMLIDHTTKEIYDASHFKIGVSKASFK